MGSCSYQGKGPTIEVKGGDLVFRENGQQAITVLQSKEGYDKKGTWQSGKRGSSDHQENR